MRLCWFVLIGLSTFSLLQSPPPASFITWANRHAIVLKSVEATADTSDLKAIRSMIGNARVVALGETHGTHEFLQLRNRLFRYLVEEMGFHAIAVESGVTEAMKAEAYVLGDSVDKK